MISKVLYPSFYYGARANWYRIPKYTFAYRKPSTNNATRNTEKTQKSLWLFNVGVLAAIFGAVYMMVPMYKAFCQKMGLAGDTHQKDYSKLAKTQKSNRMRKFDVVFEGECTPELGWDFEPETKKITVHAGETALTFYRALNKQTKPVIGVAVYSVYPEFASQYFSKIQCFCFNQQLLNPGEEVLMPLYFYFEPEIEDDLELGKTKTIHITYRFFLAKKQGLAEMIHQQNLKDLTNKINILEGRKGKREKADPEYAKLDKQIATLKVDLDNLLTTNFTPLK